MDEDYTNLLYAKLKELICFARVYQLNLSVQLALIFLFLSYLGAEGLRHTKKSVRAKTVHSQKRKRKFLELYFVKNTW